MIQRQGYGYISWKRYKGGTTGEIWIDQEDSGKFVPLIQKKANFLRPLWIKDRIYFLSDFEGKGNLYSCTPQGEDLQRHTDHEDFYVRHIQHNQTDIVYSCGGDLYRFDILKLRAYPIPIAFSKGPLAKVREFKDPSSYLSSYSIHPKGKSIALTTRGRLFHLTPYKGAAEQRGQRDGVRYRLASWLYKGDRYSVICDKGNEEILEIYGKELEEPASFFGETFGVDWGKIVETVSSPTKDELILTNHRNELIWIDIENKKGKVIDRSTKDSVLGASWSPDGCWIVYSVVNSHKGASLKLYHVKTEKIYPLTDGAFKDFSPVFDPQGKYIYFLSSRSFAASWDPIRFNLNFSCSIKPFVMMLQKDVFSPFIKPFLESEEEEKDKNADKGKSEKKDEENKEKEENKEIKIDLEGISERIEAFPVPSRNYGQLNALNGKVMYIAEESEAEGGSMYVYDLNLLKEESLISGIEGFTLSADQQWMAYHTPTHRLRFIAAGTKGDDSDTSFQNGGWIDFQRIPLSVCPMKEWIHMFDEAWRLQKELFWMPSMGGIDWDEVYRRYRPCVDRVSSFFELLTVMADMFGELGTSHAYIFPKAKSSSMDGILGAELRYDEEKGAYKICGFDKGDCWDSNKSSPLLRSGLNIKEGDLILAIGGQKVSKTLSPEILLLRQAKNGIPFVVSDKEGENKRTVIIFPLSSGKSLQYRDWVEKNRKYVHEKTQERVGYIHIPDMSPDGFSEFLRSYLQEFDREGLIIDVRFNGGGNVSPLILDYLARKRLGYDQSRWHGIMPYPDESPKGPMAALINQWTGSDGDIFAYSFRKLGLGPLVGKRTWGGVVGIHPRYDLLEGTLTSQPEFSFWFHEIGWGVENYGVEPDIEIEISPQAYHALEDPQLDKGIEEVMRQVKETEILQKEKETPPCFPVLVSPLFPKRKND